MDKEVSYKISWMTFIKNIKVLFEHANLGICKGTLISEVMSLWDLISVPVIDWLLTKIKLQIIVLCEVFLVLINFLLRTNNYNFMFFTFLFSWFLYCN